MSAFHEGFDKPQCLVSRSGRIQRELWRFALLALVALTVTVSSMPEPGRVWPLMSFGAWLALGAAWSIWFLRRCFRTESRDVEEETELIGRSRRSRLWLAPRLTPRWPALAFTIWLFALSCWAISVPGGYLIRVMVLPSFWLLVGVIWLGRMIASLVIAHWRIRELRWRNWLVQPLIAALMVVLAVTDAPIWGAYYFSRGAMNDQARAVLAGKDPQTIHRIGAYRILWAQKTSPTSFQFVIDGAGFIDPVGFAYSEKGPPPAVSPSTYEHWDGPWYVWTERF